jgi:alpha-ketoglutaric semialdehyde dehydrogenase
VVTIGNVIDGTTVAAESDRTFPKVSPVDGSVLGHVAASTSVDVAHAVDAAKRAQIGWAARTAVERGDILFAVAAAMRQRRDDIARTVAAETGKSMKDARGETDAAIALAMFMAGEGRRLYGRSLTSAVPNKHTFTVRQPLGVAGLIVAANTPIANVAWKVFPALVCGNAAVLKAPEDAPDTASIFAAVAHEAGLPPGVLNVIHGFGPDAGEPIVEHPDVSVVSFTGSTAVGRRIAEVAGRRLARTSLELGGKNPLVVCDDADLANAVRWTTLSAFSNAGQRCASASRIIVFASVYHRFRDLLLTRTRALRVGPDDEDDFGPVINARQLDAMEAAVSRAAAEGARLLIGGRRLDDEAHAAGCYMAPTLLENVAPDADISTCELFGPIACLYQVRDFAEAVAMTNRTPYGLTAAIHTKSVDRALEFGRRALAGVVVVNGGTYGSEPHMPFGGFKASGNGSREPGVEALDVYSELKNICVMTDATQV